MIVTVSSEPIAISLGDASIGLPARWSNPKSGEITFFITRMSPETNADYLFRYCPRAGVLLRATPFHLPALQFQYLPNIPREESAELKIRLLEED